MSDYDAPFQAVLDYLDSKNFKYTPYPDDHQVTLNMSGKNACFRFTARISHEGEYLQICANLPFFVRDEKQRLSVAELITRANYCMPLGKFEMDMKDGEVRFHITHVIGELGLSSALIEKHFMTAYYTADRYFPAFMQHLHAGYTPEDAVFHSELDTQADLVEDTPKPKVVPKSEQKSKEKAKNPPSEEKPRRKRVHRKKSSDDSGRDASQGDLPI